MHCPSTGPGISLLVHPSQNHLSPRISYQLGAAAETRQKKQVGKQGARVSVVFKKKKNLNTVNLLNSRMGMEENL